MKVLKDTVVLATCGVTAQPMREFWSTDVSSHEVSGEDTGKYCL